MKNASTVHRALLRPHAGHGPRCAAAPRERFAARAALLALAVLAACGDGGGSAELSGPASDPPAVLAFREAFETQRYDLVPALVEDLERAAAAAPDDPRVGLTLALANLWGAAEISRIGGDPAREATHAFDALAQLESASRLAPDDARIDGFIGAVRMRIGLRVGDADLVARGLAEIEAGIARHPEFNAFVAILVLSRLERDDPRFAGTFAAIERTMAACELPVSEATPALALEAPRKDVSGPDRVCWNGPLALHNWEGTWLFVGDAYAKAGRGELARALYGNAQLFESYASWGFRPLLEARIATADELAARSSDDDPSSDPERVADPAGQCAVRQAR